MDDLKEKCRESFNTHKATLIQDTDRIYAAMMIADTMGASMHHEPQGGLFAKSYDKDFNRKKKRRKMAKVSRKRNRRV